MNYKYKVGDWVEKIPNGPSRFPAKYGFVFSIDTYLYLMHGGKPSDDWDRSLNCLSARQLLITNGFPKIWTYQFTYWSTSYFDSFTKTSELDIIKI